MIVDHRTYDVSPGRLADYVALYRASGWAVQKRHLGTCLGWHVSTDIGVLNQIVHLWAFETLQDRADRRAALAADPDWQNFRIQATPMLLSMRNAILTPVAMPQ
jgi:hypothetical protein